MTTAVERTVTAIIQAIATKQGTQGEYCTVTTQPRPGLKFPDNYNAWDAAVVKGFQTGDSVVLTLQKGKAKRNNPQKENDWYWDLVGIATAKVEAPTSKIEIKPYQAKAVTQPVTEPWHRYLSWAELVAQARLMVGDTLFEDTPKPAWIDYAGQFRQALALICGGIRKEMGQAPIDIDTMLEETPEPALGDPQTAQEAPQRPSGPKADVQAHPEVQRPALGKAQGEARVSRATYARLETLWAKGSGLSDYTEIREDLAQVWKARQARLGLSGLMTEAQCLAWIKDIEIEGLLREGA